MKKYLFILLISLMTGLIYAPKVVASNPSQSNKAENHTPTNATIEITYQGTWPWPRRQPWNMPPTFGSRW